MSDTRQYLLAFLCLLILLTVLAVLAANMGWLDGTPQVEAFAKWGLGVVLAEIMALFVFVTRNVFRQPTYSLMLSAPTDLPGLDVMRISWDRDKCFVSYGDKKVNVKPAFEGVNFEIRLPPKIIDKITDTDAVEVELVDKKGNRWVTQSVFLFRRTMSLIYLESRETIIKSYEVE